MYPLHDEGTVCIIPSSIRRHCCFYQSLPQWYSVTQKETILPIPWRLSTDCIVFSNIIKSFAHESQSPRILRNNNIIPVRPASIKVNCDKEHPSNGYSVEHQQLWKFWEAWRSIVKSRYQHQTQAYYKLNLDVDLLTWTCFPLLVLTTHVHNKVTTRSFLHFKCFRHANHITKISTKLSFYRRVL